MNGSVEPRSSLAVSSVFFNMWVCMRAGISSSWVESSLQVCSTQRSHQLRKPRGESMCQTGTTCLKLNFVILLSVQGCNASILISGSLTYKAESGSQSPHQNLWTHLVSVVQVFSFRCRSELCWRRWRCVSHTETSGLYWDSSVSCWWRPCRCWTRGPDASVGSGSWRWPPPSPREVDGATEEKISAPALSPESEDARCLVQNRWHVWLVESTDCLMCLLFLINLLLLTVAPWLKTDWKHFRSTLRSSRHLMYPCPCF